MRATSSTSTTNSNTSRAPSPDAHHAWRWAGCCAPPNRPTPTAWMMSTVQDTIGLRHDTHSLIRKWITFAEHKGVTSGERRRYGGIATLGMREAVDRGGGLGI